MWQRYTSVYMTSKHYKEENLLPSHKYIEECEFVPEYLFMQDWVYQVAQSTGYLFDDICGGLNLNSNTERQ